MFDLLVADRTDRDGPRPLHRRRIDSGAARPISSSCCYTRLGHGPSWAPTRCRALWEQTNVFLTECLDPQSVDPIVGPSLRRSTSVAAFFRSTERFPNRLSV